MECTPAPIRAAQLYILYITSVRVLPTLWRIFNTSLSYLLFPVFSIFYVTFIFGKGYKKLCVLFIFFLFAPDRLSVFILYYFLSYYIYLFSKHPSITRSISFLTLEEKRVASFHRAVCQALNEIYSRN